MTEKIQRSFAGGEIAPALHARADMAKFATGLATCRNMQVQKHGGASNRAGTQFIAEVKDSTKNTVLIDFQFNDEQTYIIEVGEGYMRFIRSAAQIVLSTTPPTWVTSTAYTKGDVVTLTSFNFYCKLDHTSSASDEPLVGGSWQTYWHQLTSDIYEIPTDYLEADLDDIHWVQSGDIITLVHPNYPPRHLKRFGNDDWLLEDISFLPVMDRPTALDVTAGPAGSKTFSYKVTAIRDNSFEESLPAFGPTFTITGATQANPVVITTSAANEFKDDDEVYIDGIVGMTELNGRYFTINQLTTTTFELVGEDGTGHTAYSSGGEVNQTSFTITSAGDPTDANPHVITWTGVSGALEYFVYRAQNGVYGYIGTATGQTFNDTNFTPNVDETPPIAKNPFDGAGNYPSDVTYYQQRQVFANTTNEPEKIWTSRTADYNNFSIRSPLQDDDAISFTIAGREVNQVRNMMELDRLIVLTTGGEHLIEGDVDGILRPGAINPKQQGHNGSAILPPIAISNVAIYLQARGSVIRDLKIEQDKGYVGSDLTVFAVHLFENKQIVDWDYSQIPNSVLWACRDDGVLLGLTYLPEHEVWGWHRHDTTNGYFEKVRVVPDGAEDLPYFIVRRTINGQTKRFIERMKSRSITDIAIDAFFVDSGLTYDGRNTNLTRDMRLTGGTLWTYQEDLTLTCTNGYFIPDDVGNAVVLKLVDTEGNITDTLTCNIISYTSTTVVTVQATKDVPVGFQSVWLNDYALAVDELSGLDHLEGETVNILADGNVEPQGTVTAGAITIQRPAEIVHIGLPIQADFETLDLDSPQDELVSKEKLVTAVTMQVESSRGIWAGPDETNLTEWAQREFEEWGEPTALKTGKVYLPIETSWNSNGRVFVRQDDPLPLTILSVVPEGAISD